MIKQCKICKEDINTHTDRHGVFKDMDGKKEVSKGFYHFNCFMDRIKAKNSEKQLHEKAMGILNKIGGKVDEVII